MENDFKIDEAQKIIDRIFTDEQIYFVINRQSAKMLNKIAVSNSLKEEISKNTIILCNEEFDTMIEFNKLGVYRIGYKNQKEKT